MAKQNRSNDPSTVKGIGSKIKTVLADAGIKTNAKLAKTSVKRLRAILAAANLNPARYDPSTWPGQAAALLGNRAASKKKATKKQAAAKKPAAKAKPKKKAKPAPADQASTATVVVSGFGNQGYLAGKPFRIERLLTPEEVWQEYEARKEELDLRVAEAEKALERWMPKLRKTKQYKRGQITGACTRFRTKFGHVVSPLQVVIAINVERKLPLEDLKAEGIAPIQPSFEGIPIKILEGEFELLPTPQANLLRGTRVPQAVLPLTEEITGGVPIAPPSDRIDFGTLGAIVSDSAGTFHGLTCQHVVQAEARTDQIGPWETYRDLGKVQQRIGPPQQNHQFNGIIESLDCAKIRVEQFATGQSIVFPPLNETWIRGLSHGVNETPSSATVTPIYYATRRMTLIDGIFPLVKFGNGSGHLTRGRIDSVEHLEVRVNGQPFTKNFTVQAAPNRNSAFAKPGDSGSIVALEAKIDGKDVYVAVGILFAALENSSVGLACNMSHVIDALNLDAIIPATRLTNQWSLRG